MRDNLQGIKKPEGLKESTGKLEYDFDWDFIEAMAKRMSKNRSKYPKSNWKKPLNVEELKEALFRHTMEIMKGNYTDDEVLFDHLVAGALNNMFIYYQLKNHGKS